MWGVAQEDSYRVELLPFNSRFYDDFAPVIMEDGILFCSNRKTIVFIDYKDTDDTRLSNIFKVVKKDSLKWGAPKLLSKDLTSVFNEGPASYNKKAQTIYFTRNISSDKKNRSDDNNLGIFYAKQSGDSWVNIREFPHNDTAYQVAHPSISEDGKMLFFSSDDPIGYGRSDLYVSRFENSVWSEPENLGPNVNSANSELYPFIYSDNRLYFASDNSESMGGLDIFVTNKMNGIWSKSVRLESPVNSSSDDFGYVVDSTLSSGFFSSNRNRSDDIYSFSSLLPSLLICAEQQPNKYCYLFSDEGTIDLDTVPNVIYQWSLGDETKKEGLKVKHCYKDPGSYKVELSIVDTLGGDIYFVEASYEFDIVPREQVFISSADTCFAGEEVQFNGTESYLPDFIIDEYYWDFDEGNKSVSDKPSNIFLSPGIYRIHLLVKGISEDPGEKQEYCSYKAIVVLDRKNE